ncbi:MAG: S41 family peptidase [Candidatus Marinimicrobia bacterium]|nr:S41 family peptidase [Candidatus Neomarinimicrobiota bacterium]
MKLKNKILIIFASILIFASITFSSSDINYLQNRDKLVRAFDLIYQNYTDEINSDELTAKTIEKMVDELDPFTNYLRKQSKFSLSTLAKGNYGGVGFRINMQNDTLTVLSLMEDEPAWRAGIYPGDQIIKIDNKSIADIPFNTISELIRGKPKTKVILTILRQKKEITFPIIRKKIIIKEIPYSTILDKNVGYIKLNGFSKNAHNELMKKLIEFNQSKIKYLILDLRNNSGGLLTEAKNVMDILIGKNKLIVYTRGKHSHFNHKLYSQKRSLLPKKVKLAILINNKSASASEIVAGAIQDYDRGIILGKTSVGKGLVQHVYNLDDTSAVKITTSKYFLPSKRWIQKVDYYDENKIINANIDSTKKYFTQNGREVNANIGIEPDSILVEKKLSNIAKDLIKKKHTFEYARTFMLENPKDNNFNNMEKHFLNFIGFLNNQNYKFINPTIKKIEELENKLNKNDTLSEDTKKIFETLKKSFILDTKELLEKNKNEITDILQIELAGFYGGTNKKYKYKIKNDEVIKNAILLLKSDSYDEILNIK